MPTAFPRATSPAYLHTDFPWETSPVNWGANGGMMTYPAAECVMPSKYWVPHNQRDETEVVKGEVKAYPSLSWTPMVGNESEARYSYAYPHLFSEIGVESYDGEEVPPLLWNSALNCQGFTFMYRRTDFANVKNRGGENENEEEEPERLWSLRFVVGTGEDALGYALTFQGQGQVLVEYYDPRTDSLAPIKAADGSGDVTKTLWGAYATNNEYTTIDTLILGGKLFVSIGSQDNPVMIDEARIGQDGKPIQRISKVEVRSVGHKTMYWSCHPTKFRASTYHDSVQFPIGFRSQYSANWQITPAGGWSDLGGVAADISEVYHDSLQGPMVQYQLSMRLPVEDEYKGVSYGSFAPGIHSVMLFWPRGPVAFVRGSIDPLQPEALQVTQRFDPGTLQIRSGASLNFNNNTGFWGQWSQASGQVAINVGIARTSLESGLVPDFYTVFTGFGHTSGAVSAKAGASTFSMSCEDRVRQLMTPRWSLPWMDGWNSIFAIAYLAQLGGVPIEDMAFKNYVPNNPYDDWGDPNGTVIGGAYFMPVGYFSTNLTRYSGASLWEIMSKIAYSIGYMLYFDRDGLLNFHKFWLPLFDNGMLFPVKRTFYESDNESGGAEGCWSITSMKSMDNVRNKAIVVGVNSFSPSWEPVVMAITDMASIFDPFSPNYLGYVQPVVLADNQFADPAYAWQACQGLIEFMRLPERKVMFETWFQPDIYPLDCVLLRSPRAGTVGLKFMVTAVTHSLDQFSQVGKTRIEAMAMSALDLLVNDHSAVIG